MASYQDERHIKFNPYVQQLPVEDMVKVGMAKQGQYNDGVQRIQQNIDNIAGMDIYRDVDKRYLQSRLNKLGKDLRFVAAGDFSNFQLVNSVNGMSNQIANDEYVRNAQASTAHIRKEQTQMAADEKAGKLTPDNAFKFNKQLAEYAASEDLEQSFGAPYIPHFDVFKFAKETFDAVKPDGLSFDQVYELGADGKPTHDRQGNLIYSKTMTRMESEGISTDKVKATLGQIFSDPRVGQQLQISGEYNYRGLDAPALGEKVWNQKQEVMGAYDDQLSDLLIQKGLGKDVQDKIDALESSRSATAQSYDDYIEMTATNPDAVRGMMFKDDVSARYTTMFGYMKTKTQIMDNPGWKANWDIQKEANAQSRWAQDMAQKKFEFSANYAQKERHAILSYQAKIAKDKENDGKIDSIAEQDFQASSQDVVAIQEKNYNEAAASFRLTTDNFIWQSMLGRNEKNIQKLKALENKGMSTDEAVSFLIDNTARSMKLSPEEFRTTMSKRATIAYNKTTSTEREARPSLNKALDDYTEASKIFANESAVKEKIDRESSAHYGTIKRYLETVDNSPQTLNIRGRKVNVNKEDLVDLALANGPADKSWFIDVVSGLFQSDDVLAAKKRDSEAAVKRLHSRGKGDLIPIYKSGGLGAYGGNLKDLKTYNEVKSIVSSEDYNKLLDKKAAVVKESYGVNPNKKQSIMGGTAAENKIIFNNIKRWATNYATNGSNASSDFKKFTESLGKNLEDSTLEAKMVPGPNNTAVVEIVSSDGSGRVSGMTISRDEAASIGINVDSLYESKEIASLRTRMGVNHNSTSAGDPYSAATYIQNDVYFQKRDFPLMANTPFDIKANITFQNNLYVPHVYVSSSDGRNHNVIEYTGTPDLQTAVKTIQGTTPTLAQAILMAKAPK